MFKLESYITPLLMGYLDEYVKLRPEDLQLSLWGGDAVLYNLDLRLDVLEKILQLPITFSSGHIHELRLHVPWTKLGSEPIVVTINTVECILKVRDTAYEETSGSVSSDSSGKTAASGRIRKKVKRQTTEDLPPGYLQSIVNRMVNNVTFIVNNLIIKFVEDDIVFSMNVKSAECYSCDVNWKRAFVDLTLEDLALRKVINFSDLTVCLDKSSSDGRIDNYQEPMLYRCFVMCRLHLTYDSLHAKFPCVTRLNVFSEKLDCLLTDTQLPMFIRLVELCMALYFGYLDLPSPHESSANTAKPSTTELQSFAPYSDIEQEEDGEGENVGWAAWMWSMVPQILTEDEDKELHPSPSHPRHPLFSLGFYIQHLTVTFKLTEQVRSSGSLKLTFHPLLVLEASGLAVEVLMHGTTFFDVQFGVTHFALSTAGPCICGWRDVVSSKILACGDKGNSSSLAYTGGSLFDPFCCENRGEKGQFVVDGEAHLQMYTESYGLQHFGAFWFDYVSTLDLPESGHSSSSSDAELEDCTLFDREKSTYRFIFGQSHIYITSSGVHRIQKFLACAWDHHYEPYKSSKPDAADHRVSLTDSQLTELEEFLPTCSYHLTLLQPTVTILPASHPQCNIAAQEYSSRHVKEKRDHVGTKGAVGWLEAKVSAERFDMQLVTPMYPARLARLVSNIAGPSSNLMYHCHSHTQFKVFSLQASLGKTDASSITTPPVKLVPPCSAAFYSRSLVLPHIWKNSHLPLWERSCEVPQVSLTLSKVSLMAAAQLASSWLQQQQHQHQLKKQQRWHLHPSENFEVQLQDLFPEPGTATAPMLELTVSNTELRVCSSPLVTACTASLSSIQLLLYLPGTDAESTSILPLLYGPVNAGTVADRALFQVGPPSCTGDMGDCFAFLLQKPHHTTIAEAVPAVVVVRLEGLIGCLDPGLLAWFAYTPTYQQATLGSSSKAAALDLSLAQATSPLQLDGSRMSVRSSSSHTVPNTSRVYSESHTVSKTPSSFPEHRTYKTSGKTQEGLGPNLCQLFPLLRILQVQVDIKSSCVFVPETSVRLREPSVDIAGNMWSLWWSGQLQDVLVLCVPAVTIRSVGASCIPVLQDIPITSLDGSLLGDKLPWTVHLSQWSVFSLHEDRVCLPMLEVMDLSSTVGVTVQYDPPTSDTIHSLALCVHLDITPPEFTLMHKQMALSTSISRCAWDLSSCVMQLYQNIVSNLLPTQSGSHSAPAVLESSSADHASGDSGQAPLDSSGLGNMEASTGDTFEEFSQESGPVHRLNVTPSSSDDPSLKLSAWLQLVMARCTVSLHTVTGGSQVKMVLEDFGASCDVQQVYSKIKVSLGAISINKYRQTSAGEWRLDSDVPVILSTLRHLPQHVSMVSNKQGVAEGHSSDLYLSGQGGPAGEKRHGFLSVTYTRALCKNVLSKIKALNVEVTNPLGTSEQQLPSALFFHKWLSEICLKVEAFDVVFHVPTVKEIRDVWIPVNSGREQNSSAQPSLVCRKSPGTVLHPSMSTKQPSVTAAHVCPLVHADVGHVRVFLLTEEYGQALSDHVVREPFPGTTMAHDMLLCQVQSMHVQPYADNPLPRYPAERELFHCALQAGQTQQAGFCMEDRQYQMNIAAMSLSSGSWTQWSGATRDSGKLTTMAASAIQIPALEWNTYLGDRKKMEEAEVVPIVMPFNTSLIVAPPIVYVREEQEEQGILVCGLTAELNVKTDLEMYLSAEQLHLVMTAATAASHLASEQHRPSSSRGTVHEHYSPAPGVAADSGIESDLSRISSHALKRRAGTAVTPACTMPVDVLLTAGRVSLMVYAHTDSSPKTPGCPGPSAQLSQASLSVRKAERHEMLADNFTELTSGIDALGDRRPSADTPSSPQMVHGESTQGPRGVLHAGSLCVQPFMYVYLAQPHTLIKIWPDVDKVELSCYDILIKGADETYVFPVVEHHLLPDLADFTVHWLETRAGKPHTKTGIPPCLLTFSVASILTPPGSLELKLERPVKLNVMCDAVKQMIDFLQKLFPKQHETSQGSCQAPRLFHASNARIYQERTQAVQGLCGGIVGLLEAVERVHVSTEQIVLSFEAKNTSCTGGFLASVKETSFTLETTLKPSDKSIAAEGCMCLKDILLKTSYNRQRRRLAGPVSAEVDASLLWPGPGFTGTSPQLVLHTHMGLLEVHLGQEHVFCLEHLCSQFQAPLATFAGSSQSKAMMREKVDEESKENVKKPFSTVRHSQDDLRSGCFAYIHHADSEVLPEAWEIAFSEEDRFTPVQGAMTWAYPEPRVITRLTVVPVPLLPYLPVSASENLSVPCVLQYWDECRRHFVSYAHFTLSENKRSVVDVPEIIGSGVQRLSGVFAARTWRIAVLVHAECDEGIGPRDDEQYTDTLALVTSLAASVSVDSCAVPDLVPLVQASLTIAVVSLHVANHLDYNGSRIPDKLQQFMLCQTMPSDQEWAVVTLRELQVFASHTAGLKKCTSVMVSGTSQVDVLDYSNLTLETFLSPVTVHATASIRDEQAGMPFMEVRARSSKLSVHMTRSIVHTLNVSLQAWKTFGPNSCSDAVVFGHLIICNNTQETLRFGQVDTDENLALVSQHMMSYSWRSSNKTRQLHMCLDKSTWRWCSPICAEAEGCAVRVVRAMDQHYTLIIKIRRLSPVYLQLIISGQLVLSNQLSQPLELHVMLSDQALRTDSTAVVKASSVLPSLVVEHDHVCAVRVRFPGGQGAWCDVGKLGGKAVQENQLLKVMLPDGNSFVHMWCHVFCQRFNDAMQKLIVFSPLFVLRSHLPHPLLVKVETPSSRQVQQLELCGQGHEFQLYCKGESTAHHLSFKLGPNLPHSCPPVVLSDDLVQQVKEADMSFVDIDQLCQQHSETKMDISWPYIMPHSDSSEHWRLLEAQQPSIDLNVHLSQHQAACSTVLVDIAPWCLLTNMTPCSLVLIVSGHQLHVPNGTTIAPPRTQEFSLGLQHGGLLFETRTIQLSKDGEEKHRYSSDREDVLFVDGQVHTQLLLPPERESSTAQVLALSVSSNYVKGIRVLTVSQQFTLINGTPWNLEAQLLAVAEGASKVQLQDRKSYASSFFLPRSNQENMNQLLIWQRLGPESSHLVFYMMLKVDTVLQDTTKCEGGISAWSVPVRVPWTRDGLRSTVAVSRCQEDVWCSSAVCVTCHRDGSNLYVVLTPDNAPMCILHNQCPFVLEFGQGLDRHLYGALETVLEETETLKAVPCIPSFGWCHYTMPHVSDRFPDVDTGSLPLLHVRAVTSQHSKVPATHDSQSAGEGKQRSAWSPGVSLGSANTFLQIPAVANIKVSVQATAMLKHVTFSLVSKAEVSSTDVFQHTKGMQEVLRLTSSQEAEGHKAMANIKTEEAYNLPVRIPSRRVPTSQPLWPALAVEVCLEALALTLWDDWQADILSEILHVSLQHVLLTCYPVGGVGGSTSMAVCFGDLHVYNPMAHHGHFDFPVVVMSQKSPELSEFKLTPGLGLAEQHAVLRAASAVQLQVVLSKDSHYSNGIVAESVHMGIKPLSIYVEDTFIVYLTKEWAAYRPVSLSTKSGKSQQQGDTVERISGVEFCSVVQPLRVQHICLQPCNILLSVHASVKMFLATDHTPLAFGAFERQGLFTSMQQLVYSIAMHYVTSAIFRAGMVVGSLDILGSPTGLVRSVGMGVTDFVRLPYQGLIQGPVAFFTGVRGGTASLLRNVTAGVVTSVTNFASSISRNMDRLSLDEEHRERQEEIRRRRPSGLSSGLWQGLSGFGLSLLGAVAGLVDRPIQTVLEVEQEPKLAKRAGQLAAGLGKGLIGVITKPIGGAAELVSQTGQGLLHGAGLRQTVSLREPATDIQRQNLPAGLLKYSMKALPDTEVLVMVTGLQEDLLGDPCPVVLVLTTDMVTVISCEDDTQQQILSLSELECYWSPPDVLTLTIADTHLQKSNRGCHGNEDLVAAFVSSTVAHLPLANDIEREQEDGDVENRGQLSSTPREAVAAITQFADPNADAGVRSIPPYFQPGDSKAGSAGREVAAEPASKDGRLASYDFQVMAEFAELFLAAFCQAKHNQLGKGFLV